MRNQIFASSRATFLKPNLQKSSKVFHDYVAKAFKRFDFQLEQNVVELCSEPKSQKKMNFSPSKTI